VRREPAKLLASCGNACYPRILAFQDYNMPHADLRPLIAGNWKMNGTKANLAEICAMAASLKASATNHCDTLICPPATLISAALALAGGRPWIGAQDCHFEPAGAHTGDLSAAMLADAGANIIIVGHSERRADHGERNADVAGKAGATWNAGLTAIICVGETLTQRDAGEAVSVVREQLAGSIPDGATAIRCVIAYEPVWAIGTGRTPTLTQIEEIHGAIRAALITRFGSEGAGMRILYGGSVKPANAREILALEDVNGALVGGASLKATDFLAIVDACG
jgi:triosephosphate isomerase (TIM)